MFITFEGGEGTGKSTHIQRLSSDLSEMGYNVALTREPGGTPSCEMIRDIILDHPWEPLTEVLLFAASRHEHCEKLIKPALIADKIVLCDRFMDSTIAYQGYGLGLSLEFLRVLQERIVTTLPHVTFILDMDPSIGQQRIKLRKDNNHLDARSNVFYNSVRRGFLTIAQQNPDRCIVIDASQSLDEVYAMIYQHVLKRLHHKKD